MGFFDFFTARRNQNDIQPSPEVTLEHAEQHLVSGDFTKAEQDYQQLCDAHPDDPRGWIGYAHVAQRDKRWNEACQRWQTAAERFPERFEPTYNHARTLETIGELKQAEARFAELTIRFPDRPPALFGYARLAEKQKSWANARERWQAAAGRFTELFEPAAGVARALKELGELDQAEVCYADLTVRFPEQAVGWIEHARIAVHQKRWADACIRWQAAAERFPKRFEPAYGFARALELLGDLEQAEACFAELAGRFSDQPSSLIGYARLAEKLKNWLEACERWQAATERFADLLEPAAGMARTLEQLGELEQAEARYAEITNRFPAQAVGWIGYARIAESQKRWTDALERWTVAAERFPQQFVCVLGKARALLYAEAYEDARLLLDDISKRFGQPAQIKRVEQLYAQLPS